MRKIVSELVEVLIKKSDSYPEEWCLVHDGKVAIAFVAPGSSTWVGENRIMLMGTEEELRTEIKRLNLEIPNYLQSKLESKKV